MLPKWNKTNSDFTSSVVTQDTQVQSTRVFACVCMCVCAYLGSIWEKQCA